MRSSKKYPKLSDADALTASELAFNAIQKIGKARFTVYATLDITKPETIDNFKIFEHILLDAYKKGLEAAKVE